MAETTAQPVHVVDPYGNLGTIDASEAQDAVSNGGFRLASPEEVQGFQDQQTYGTGAGSALKATALGAARSATFGLSDEFLVHSGAMKPEDVEAYKKYRPGYTAAGEVGGVAGALLAPEAEGAALLLNPVQAVAKAGGAIAEAAAPAAEGLAGVIANPETSPVINKILTQAGAHAVGSAVEGAAYGLGQSVSEDALGDPDLNAEKVMSNVGYGAALGGVFGSVLGGIKGGVEAKFPKFLSEVDKAKIDSGDFGAMVENSDLSDGEKQAFDAGLTKLRKDAPEIKEAAQELGAPVLPGMISDSEAVKKGQSALLEGPPSYFSLKAQQMAKQGFDKVSDVISNTLGDSEAISKANLGDTLKDIVSTEVQKQSEPINALYDELKSKYQAIPASDKAINQIANNIRNLEDVPLSPQVKRIAESAAERVESLKTVDDVKRLKSIINSELPATAAPIEKRTVAIIADKLSNLEENSIVRFAQNEMKTSTAKDKIMQLLDQREAANAQYSVFRDKLERLGEVLGKRKVHGAQDFLDFLNDLTPEKMADKISGKNNSEFLGWFSKEFPEGMDAVRQHQKSLIREASMKNGEFNIRAALKQVDKFPKEFREKIFSPDELRRLSLAKKYIEAFPPNFNPSNTSNASAFRHFFEGPVGATVGNVRDAAIHTFINAAVSGSDEVGSTISGLGQIERMAGKTTKSIASGVNAIFSTKSTAVPVQIMLSVKDKQNELDKVAPKLAELNSNPEKLIDTVSDATLPIANIAPKHAEGLQGAMTRATSFLQTKLPTGGPQKPLSPKYKPSNAELSKFFKYMSVVENPTDALKQVAQGTITPETMETLQAVYPKLLNEMQVSVMSKLTSHVAKNSDMPYRTKLALSMFLGQDLVDSLNPQSMAANQMILSQATANKQAQESLQLSSMPRKSGDKINKAGRMLTAMQSTAQREEA